MADTYAASIHTPLFHWAAAGDRNLPMALAEYSLETVLNMPFERLFATPGIGVKKMGMLLVLLERIASAGVPGATSPERYEAASAEVSAGSDYEATSDRYADISNARWSLWCQCILARGLAKAPLGRFVRTLRVLPKTFWAVPLDAYALLSIQELWARKGHGRRRVEAILDVFGDLHRLLQRTDDAAQLGVRISTKRIIQIEDWVSARSADGRDIVVDEMQAKWSRLLIEQLRVDLGEEKAAIINSVLTSGKPDVSLVAREFAIARQRIYVISAEATLAIGVRWPDAEVWLGRLRERIYSSSCIPAARELFRRSERLMFCRGKWTPIVGRRMGLNKK